MEVWGEGVNGHEEGIEGVDIVQLRVSSSSYIIYYIDIISVV